MELRVPPGRLECRIRLMLRAYPPGYRADRGEEVLGTLLEATADGRDWPSARDCWSLLAGGTRARRASNRQLAPPPACGRRSSLASCSTSAWGRPSSSCPTPSPARTGHRCWPGGLLAATALAVWAGHRTLMITSVAASSRGSRLLLVLLLARAGLFRPPLWLMVNELMSAVTLLLAMLALVHLTRRDGRPPRSWLILACAPLLAMLVTRTLPVLLRPDPAPGVLWNLVPDVFLLLAIPALAWLATDARPALGVALAHVVAEALPLATAVQAGIADHQRVANVWQWDGMGLEKLALAVVMTAALAWMLRRRTQPHPR